MRLTTPGPARGGAEDGEEKAEDDEEEGGGGTLRALSSLCWSSTCPPQPTPCTPHPTPCTPHPTPYALHPTPHTLHPTPYTPKTNPSSVCSRKVSEPGRFRTTKLSDHSGSQPKTAPQTTANRAPSTRIRPDRPRPSGCRRSTPPNIRGAPLEMSSLGNCIVSMLIRRMKVLSTSSSSSRSFFFFLFLRGVVSSLSSSSSCP